MRFTHGIGLALRRMCRSYSSGSGKRPESSTRKTTTPVYTPYGRDGSGFYSDNALGYYSIIQNATPMVMDAIHSMVINPKQVFNIVDYGSADGGTSMPLLYQMIDTLRRTYGDVLQIHVTYEDQSVADFKSLFMRLQGELQMPDSHSYLQDFSNVYVSTCGRSFFEQCFPSGSVNFGFSSTAMHWLSRKPCALSDAVLHMVSRCEKDTQQFADQAAQDWELILLQRAKELAPGGRMVLVNCATDESGYYGGGRCDDGGNINLFQRLSSSWRSFAERGIITEEEFVNTNMCAYWRTLKEFEAPFVADNSRVQKAGLTLVSVDIKHTACVFRARWLREGGDARQHAKQFANMFRSWSNHAFYSGLSDRRSEEEKAVILDAFFKEYEDEVAEATEKHELEFTSCLVHIKKEY